jgi:hypothetical protein
MGARLCWLLVQAVICYYIYYAPEYLSAAAVDTTCTLHQVPEDTRLGKSSSLPQHKVYPVHLPVKLMQAVALEKPVKQHLIRHLYQVQPTGQPKKLIARPGAGVARTKHLQQWEGGFVQMQPIAALFSVSVNALHCKR